jgi:riboflavin biosynthesis pyrimidine reductase
MRQLFPRFVDPIDPITLYADVPAVEGRPTVRLNMIASVDGAVSVDGTSGRLGGPADHRLFAVLRGSADVVLVAAGTLRAEHYGPSAVPIAVVSRSCRLDWTAPLFAAAIARPIVITVAGAPARDRSQAAEVADVLIAGDQDVDLSRAVRGLADYGFRTVQAEGGPSLNGQLASAGLLDELCLTISPYLIGGAAGRILSGTGLTRPVGLRLHTLCEEDGFLFGRFRPTHVHAAECPDPVTAGAGDETQPVNRAS